MPRRNFPKNAFRDWAIRTLRLAARRAITASRSFRASPSPRSSVRDFCLKGDARHRCRPRRRSGRARTA